MFFRKFNNSFWMKGIQSYVISGMEGNEPILYVDDEEINLKLFELNLRNKFKVYTAPSADEGMKIINDKEIKVVISDQRMPGKTGIEFLEEIAFSHSNITRILLTAYTDNSTLVDSINKGRVYKFITKPWEPQSLENEINNALEIYNLKNENSKLVQTLKESNDILKNTNEKLFEENAARKKIESALINSERKFRNLFNSSTDINVIIDFKYHIKEFNFAFEDLYKVKREDALGKKLDFFIYSDDIFTFEEKMNALQNEHILSFFEINFLSANKEIIPVEVNSRIIDYDGDKAILVIARNIKERKEIEKNLINAIVETEEKEKRFFAEEIHDGLGPLISSMKFNLHILNEHKHGPKAELAMENLFELITESSLSIKEISNRLSPYILKDYGIVAALKSFCSKIKSRDDFKVIINEQLGDIKLNERDEIVLYRVLTELINNTNKYAEATITEISFMVKNNILDIIFQDNGKGFNLEKMKDSSKAGYGLINIGNRLKSIGCNYEIITEENKGFLFKIKMRLKTLTGT